MNDFDLKSAFDRLDESLPTVTAPIDRIRARNRRSDRRRSAAAAVSVALAVVTVLALAGVVGRSLDTHTAPRPAARPSPSASPRIPSTAIEDPQTAIARHLLASLTAGLSGTFTAAGYVIASPRHVEAVWFPGENNLQRAVPGHQMIVVKVVGRFTGVISCPPKSSCNQNFTSALTFADAATGQAITGLLSTEGSDDVTDPTGKPTLRQDLRAIGTVVRLPVG